MALVDDLLKGYGPTLLIGAGVALVVPVLLPVLGAVVRPLIKGAVKGGLLLADTAKTFVAEAGEQVCDLVAEAKAEYYSKTPLK